MGHRAKHRGHARELRRLAQQFGRPADPSHRDKTPPPRLYHCYACDTTYRQPWQMRLHHWLGCRA